MIYNDTWNNNDIHFNKMIQNYNKSKLITQHIRKLRESALLQAVVDREGCGRGGG